MKIKLSIKQKIQLYVLTLTIIVFILTFGYIGTSTKQSIIDNTIRSVDIEAEKQALAISNNLNKTMDVLTTLSTTLQAYKQFDWQTWENFLIEIYEEVTRQNPQIFSLWDSWEYSIIDSSYTKSYGRKVFSFWKENGVIKHKVHDSSMDGDSKAYSKIKKEKVTCVVGPYLDQVIGDKAERLLMTSLIVPIIAKGTYVGVVSADITLRKMQSDIKNIKPLEGSYAYLISNNGIIAGHPQSKAINTPLSDYYPKEEEQYKITEKIKIGESLSYRTINANGEELYKIYVPIFINETNLPWALAIAVPIKTITKEADSIFYIALLVIAIGIIIIAIVIFFIGRSISRPIKLVTKRLMKISKGDISNDMQLQINTGDEVEKMAEALNISVKGLLQKQAFAEQIGQGKFDNDIELLGENDSLGKSLNSMQYNLQKAKEEDEKRKKEDDKQNWIMQGQAKFADIMSSNNKDINILCSEIIKNLVKYVSANQGGIFLIKEEDEKQYLELISAYAYDRYKLMKKQIQLGEGLIGTCVQEKQTTYITDLPDNYIEITSGLGNSNPKALLMVPLNIENHILGAIEIASFKEFDKHEIQFIESVANSIASTINTVQINLRTTELLRRSQEQAREMQEQEEEMRQNMEELNATQEESARKTLEMEGLIKAIDISSFVVEYDINGLITKVNDNYLNLLNLTSEEALGTHYADNLELDKEDKMIFWEDLKKGEVKKQTSTISIKGKEYTFAETYTPIKNINGEITKILKISNLLQ